MSVVRPIHDKLCPPPAAQREAEESISPLRLSPRTPLPRSCPPHSVNHSAARAHCTHHCINSTTTPPPLTTLLPASHHSPTPSTPRSHQSVRPSVRPSTECWLTVFRIDSTATQPTITTASLHSTALYSFPSPVSPPSPPLSPSFSFRLIRLLFRLRRRLPLQFVPVSCQSACFAITLVPVVVLCCTVFTRHVWLAGGKEKQRKEKRVDVYCAGSNPQPAR